MISKGKKIKGMKKFKLRDNLPTSSPTHRTRWSLWTIMVPARIFRTPPLTYLTRSTAATRIRSPQRVKIKMMHNSWLALSSKTKLHLIRAQMSSPNPTSSINSMSKYLRAATNSKTAAGIPLKTWDPPRQMISSTSPRIQWLRRPSPNSWGVYQRRIKLRMQ